MVKIKIQSQFYLFIFIINSTALPKASSFLVFGALQTRAGISC